MFVVVVVVVGGGGNGGGSYFWCILDQTKWTERMQGKVIECDASCAVDVNLNLYKSNTHYGRYAPINFSFSIIWLFVWRKNYAFYITLFNQFVNASIRAPHRSEITHYVHTTKEQN